MDQGTINLIERTAVYEGKFIQLNERLIIAQNVSEANIKLLLETHLELMKLKAEGLKLNPETDKDELRELFSKMTDIFFEQQMLWGFDKDKELHEFWTAPHCSCPKMDNKDEWLDKLMAKKVGNEYTPHYSIRNTCPVHGD